MSFQSLIIVSVMGFRTMRTSTAKFESLLTPVRFMLRILIVLKTHAENVCRENMLRISFESQRIRLVGFAL